MKKDKKPFKDTKVFAAIQKVAPALDIGLDIASSIYPPLGVVNGLVDTAKKIAKDKKLPVSELNEAHEGYKVDYVKMLELEVEDRKSARQRQVRMAELGKIDFMFPITGIVGLGTFGYIVWAVVNGVLHESPIAHMMIGLVEGVALSIFSFYYGTSKGSKDKDEKK